MSRTRKKRDFGGNACLGQAFEPCTCQGGREERDSCIPSSPSSSHKRVFTCSPAAMHKALSALLRAAVVVVVAVEARKEEAAVVKGTNAQVWGRRRRRWRGGRRLGRGRRERAIASAQLLAPSLDCRGIAG